MVCIDKSRIHHHMRCVNHIFSCFFLLADIGHGAILYKHVHIIQYPVIAVTCHKMFYILYKQSSFHLLPSSK